jgi:hypothetical protein
MIDYDAASEPVRGVALMYLHRITIPPALLSTGGSCALVRRAALPSPSSRRPRNAARKPADLIPHRHR